MKLDDRKLCFLTSGKIRNLLPISCKESDAKLQCCNEWRTNFTKRFSFMVALAVSRLGFAS